MIRKEQSEGFTYDRTWHDIEQMLENAERILNKHYSEAHNNKLSKKKRKYHARNYKALEGVVKCLRWTLGDKNIEHPLN